MSGSAVPDTAGGPLDTTGTASTVPTSAAMDSAASHHELGISPFADSDDSSSPSPVSTDHIPIAVLLDHPRKYVSGAGVVVVDKLPDDEIVYPRVKVEPISESASSPPRPVEDFLSSESESDDDIEDYIPPIVWSIAFKMGEIVRSRFDLLLLRRRMNRYFRLNLDVDVGLDLWRDVNCCVSHLLSDDRGGFLEKQDEWVVSRGSCSQFHPHYCRDVVVAGSVIQTVQAGLRESFECLASAPLACTARQMVFSSTWAFAKNLWPYSPCSCNKEWLVQEGTALDWKLLLRDVAASSDSAVHRVHAVSFDAAVASIVSAACCVALVTLYAAVNSSSILADYVSAVVIALLSLLTEIELLIMFLLVMFLVPADRDRIC
ncbi:hypothetical protein Tco_0925443 [Tanacetum coccineum]|uniref:Transmembrane protein n=1 Tax=Tanacetum coccineum TaxID=301880 RepID=A0ABQ5DCZ5_9ASTR